MYTHHQRPIGLVLFALCSTLHLLLGGCGKSAEGYVQRGNEFASAGNYQEAILNYRNAIKKAPDLAEAHYQLGLALLKSGKAADAYQTLRRAAVVAPDRVDIKTQLLDLAWKAFEVDPQRPQAIYNQLKQWKSDLLAKDPNSFDGLRMDGNLALVDRRPGDAVAAFRKADQVKPFDPRVVHGLIISLAQMRQPDEAEKVALAMIAKDKTQGQVYDDLFALHFSRGRTADADRVFQTKVTNNPGIPAYRLQLAAHYLNSSREPEMRNTLKPLFEDAKSFPRGKLDAGEFFVKARMWDDALAAFRSAGSEPPNRLAARKLTLQALAGKQQLKEALREADEIIREFPDDNEIRSARASLLLDTKEQGGAATVIKELEQLRERQKGESMYWFLLGQAHLQQKDSKKAISSFQEAVRLSPGLTTAWSALAATALQSNLATDALRYAERTVELDPTDPRNRLLRANALVQSNRLGEARTELTLLTRAYPALTSAQLQLGVVLLAERQFPQAQRIFEKLYKPGQDDIAPLKGLAESYAAQGQQQRAYDLVSGELRQRPNATQVRRLLGQMSLAMNRVDAAVEHFRTLSTGPDKTARDYFFLGQALRAKGDVSGAIAQLQTAANMDTANPIPLSVLAFLLQETGRNAEAATVLRQVLKLQPNDANMMNNLAYLLADTGGDLKEALDLAQKAMKADPEQANYLDTLGYVYLKSKATDQALGVFERLTRMDPSNPLYLQHLAAAQWEKGQKPEARASLELALKKRPPQQVEKQIRDTLAAWR
ncbi:MAG: tetratricopeptide repeat protein [Bryobacterales bacterium]|nr:tetratricopeptide repeat protein [Bryobacterales bacterium]